MNRLNDYKIVLHNRLTILLIFGLLFLLTACSVPPTSSEAEKDTKCVDDCVAVTDTSLQQADDESIVIPLASESQSDDPLIPVTGVDAVALKCDESILALMDNITATIKGLCGNYTATFIILDEDTLPVPLDPYTMTNGFTLTILDGIKAITSFPDGTSITYSVPLVNIKDEKSVKVLYWDEMLGWVVYEGGTDIVDDNLQFKPDMSGTFIVVQD